MDEQDTATETASDPADASILAEILSGLDSDFAADAAPPPEAAPQEAAPTEEAPPAEEAPVAEETPPPPAPEADDPGVAKGLEKLVAREVELRQREDALKARESEIATLRAQLEETEKRFAAIPHDLIAQLDTSPMAALTAAGKDPDQVVRLYLAEKMAKEGKPVPAELQNAIEKANVAAEIRALRAEQQRYQQQMAAQAFVAQVESGAQLYVTRGEFKNAPTVATVAKANPGRIYSEIMDEISRDATSPGKDPKAPVLSYEEAAARVEKRWAEMKALLGGPVPGASTPAVPPPASKTAPTTKGTSATTVSPKPLTRPAPAQKSEAQILADIMKELETEARA